MPYTSVEVCAGAGGQALGLEAAGFHHIACVELDAPACATLRHNRPDWNVIEADLKTWEPDVAMRGVDLLSGGVPCPPFSIAGRQLGADDDRDLFPDMIRLTRELRPRAIMIENVRGLLGAKFTDYRYEIAVELKELGYELCGWELLDAADYGVPQTRPRAFLVAMLPAAAIHFSWPEPEPVTVTVGQALEAMMASGGWAGAASWAERANRFAPTLVGGSKKHGGADLGPTRAKRAWRDMGVEAISLADAPPGKDHKGLPRLTVEMAAALQGFPPDWKFMGRKTAAYRQVGNALPAPVAEAVGRQIAAALKSADLERTDD